jgi:hypothetical protein
MLKTPPPPWSPLFASALLAVGCVGLAANQSDISGGPGPVVSVAGGASGAGAIGAGGSSGGGGSLGSDAGAVTCLPPAAGAACSACEATACNSDYFVNGDPGQDDGVGQGIDWYDLCYEATGTASAGPMMGAKNSDLCAAVVSCVHASGCDASDSNFPCYCGAGVSGTTCVSPGFVPSGPCKDVISYGMESTDPLVIAGHQFDSAYPAGIAMGLVLLCDYPSISNASIAGPCTAACLDKGDGGAGCASAAADGGAGHDGGATGGASGAGGGTGGSGGSAGTGGNPCTVTYSFADPTGCASCELGSASDFCSTTTFLSAKVTLDDDGNAIPDGFGPDTLATTAQRDAAFALIHRVLQLQCYSDSTVSYRPSDRSGCETQSQGPCVFANLGCLLDLGQSPTDIGSGLFATKSTYSALPEYLAAAVADATAGPAASAPIDGSGYAVPGGLSPTATGSVLGSYINTWATYQSSAIGLADNVVRCALNAGCATCFNLTATTSCPAGGAGGAGGGAGTGGGAGGVPGTGGAAGHAMGGASGSGGASGATCPDLDADGVPDCRQTLVQNPGFDSTTAAWSPEAKSTAGWTSSDGTGNSASGAIAVTNVDTNLNDAPYGTTISGAFQCLTVAVGSCYQIDVQAFLPPGQGSGAAGFVLDEHITADCSQAPATSFISPQVVTPGSWQTISGTTTQIPLGVGSVAVRLVAVKPVAQPSQEALFDNVLVRLGSCAPH